MDHSHLRSVQPRKHRPFEFVRCKTANALQLVIALGLLNGYVCLLPQSVYADQDTGRIYMPMVLSDASRSDLKTRCWIQYESSSTDGVVHTIKTDYYERSAHVSETYIHRPLSGGTDRTEYTYTPSGFVRSAATDYGNDGVFDIQYQYVYDNRGNLTTRIVDDGFDGTPSEITTHYYDHHDREYQTELDNNGDLSADVVYHTSYDMVGNVILYELDNNADGDPDQVTAYRWRRTDQWIDQLIDDGNDGAINRKIRTVLDSRGRIIETKHDLDLDGIYENNRVREYNSIGLLAKITDIEAGEIHSVAYYKYDSQQRLVEQVIESHNRTRYTTRVSYGC